jgi:hypothetical protein
MQLTSVAVQDGRIRAGRGSLLVVDNLSGVILVNSEAILLNVDAKWTEFFHNFSVRPSVKDPSGIGAKGDDIPKDLQFRKRFIDLNIMALSVAFNGSCQTAKSSADNDDLDP